MITILFIVTSVICVICIFKYFYPFDCTNTAFDCCVAFSLSLIWCGVLLCATTAIIDLSKKDEIFRQKVNKSITLINSLNLEDDEYVFLLEVGNGAREVMRVQSTDCVIFFTETDSPHISWDIVTLRPKPWVNILPINLDTTENSKYSIFIPKPKSNQ